MDGRRHASRDVAAVDRVGPGGFQTCPVPLVRIDADGTCLETNRALADLLGTEADTIDGSPWTRHVHPDDAGAVVEAIERAQRTGIAQQIDHLVHGAGGAPRWIRADIASDDGGVVRSPGTRSTTGAGHLTIALTDIERTKHLELRVAELCSRDALTGTLNRAGFLQATYDAVRDCARSDGVLLAVVDLDRFSAVNSSLGHEAGDVLLAAVAARLLAAFPDDIVGRLGNDEFVLTLAPCIEDSAEAAVRLRDLFHDPFEVFGTSVQLSASVGVVEDAGTQPAPERLLARAEDALRAAKADNGTAVRFFDAPSASAHSIRCELELELASVDITSCLSLDYQPILAVSDGRLDALEALVRWRHPTRGLISPDRFIGIAEKTGSIEGITRWVIDTAIRQALTWQDAYRTAGPAIAVNASASDITDPTFVAHVLESLDRHRLDPAFLHIELTESSLLEDPEAAITNISELDAAGVAVSVDDFGTGYSSLSYLTRLSVKYVKIDRSFVSALAGDSLASGAERAHATVAGITGLAHSIGLEVVAEGVETLDQLREVETIGCDFVQGYLHSRPLSVADPRLLALIGELS